MNILLNIFFLMRIEAYRPVIKATEYPFFFQEKDKHRQESFSHKLRFLESSWMGIFFPTLFSRLAFPFEFYNQ